MSNSPGEHMASESAKVGDLIGQAREVFALTPLVAPQLERFWSAQDRILDEAEGFSRAWFERRHEAAETALEALRKANGDGTDLSAAMRAMVDWQQSSFQRLTDDVQDWVELCSRCAGRMTRAEVEAGKDGADEVAKRTKAVAKTNHSTPV
jgi:hypothetical protein